MLKREAPPGSPEALIVEMAGVEPASEERTIAICYASSPSFNARRRSTEGQVVSTTTPLGPAFAGFAGHQRGRCPTILPEVDAFLGHDRRRPARRVAYLIKQPVRSCSWHFWFSALLACNAESTMRNPDHPIPRRDHGIPNNTNLACRAFKCKANTPMAGVPRFQSVLSGFAGPCAADKNSFK